MNGRVAKKIRKEIYGNEKEEPVNYRGYTEVFGGTFVSTNERRLYLKAKKAYKEFKKTGKLPE
jgi:hypothetical protein